MSNSKAVGKFTFVLHSHLPYVLSHGNWPHGMVWLSEAAAETYIPLLDSFNTLAEEGRKIAVTIGITPVLAEQLADESFVDEFSRYLTMKIEAAKQDLENFEENEEEELAEIAKFWIEWYSHVENQFENVYNKDIVGSFKKLQDAGSIEIITCAGTHGYLPLLGNDEAVEAQIRVGVETYRKHFGRDPKGIWLPECAYRPGYHWVSPTSESGEGFDRKGVEFYLQKYGIRYFIVDNHLLQGGKAQGTYLARFEGLQKLWSQVQDEIADNERELDVEKHPYRVYWVDKTAGDGEPVGILTRDTKTSLQVWSGEYGYPGDGNYLDFHKKHFPGGHRYWRVTRAKADLGEKEIYELDKIEGRLHSNSQHFAELVQSVLEENKAEHESVNQIVSPFDTELFGHWWFEGTRWLEKVLRIIDQSDQIDAANGSELVNETHEAPVVALPEGSWGEGGFHYIWFNEDTKWTWPLIHEAEALMREAAQKYGDHTGQVKELLTQMGRELLLLESSDWQFLISTVAARDYSEMRIRVHYHDFMFVHDLLEKVVNGEGISEEEQNKFMAISQRDSIFKELDPTIWA